VEKNKGRGKEGKRGGKGRFEGQREGERGERAKYSRGTERTEIGGAGIFSSRCIDARKSGVKTLLLFLSLDATYTLFLYLPLSLSLSLSLFYIDSRLSLVQQYGTFGST